MRVAVVVGVLLVVLFAIGQQAYYWPSLPDQVASHFGANGAPDGWMSKKQHTIFMLALNAGTPLALLLLASCLRFFPVNMINIPNREYWFHESRRAETLRDNEIRLGVIAIITGLFMVGLAHLIFLANLDEGPLAMGPFAILMALFMIAIGTFCVLTLMRYRLPKDATPTDDASTT